ncbi:MAG: MbcA/ParS/Xre antitoxin family protein [Verrucomicrobia bacterium]|nr:MbcA/ParS/Xre antitoxin family protein [Verrucomicrobiota bacterium]
MVMTSTHRPNPETRETAGAALRTYFNIAKTWRLDEPQAMTLLGFDENTRSTYFRWKKDPDSARLGKDKLERLSYIFGIYKNLQILLPKAEAADGWIHRPNSAAPFGGQSALKRMLSGHVADLYEVRRYLDAERGWT